jgi:Ala-tRNA(Pro) deacylase
MHHLADQRVEYDVIAHAPSWTSQETASKAHIPGQCLAKSVLLEDDQGYVLAVVPADSRVDLGELHRLTHRRLGLASELELVPLFEDCDLGAIPPLGPVYGLETLVDDSLAEQPDVYFEAGDHEQLIHVTAETFDLLTTGARHSSFSRHA